MKLGERIELLRKTVCGIMLSLVLISILTSAFNPTIAGLNDSKNIEPVGANDVSTRQASASWPMFQHDERNTGYSTSIGPRTNYVRWTLNVGPNPSIPSFADGIVYVGYGSWYPTDWGGIVAVNASNGNVIWNCSTPYQIASVPAIANGIVYFGCYRTLYALNSTNGDVVWTKPFGIYDSIITVNDGVLFAPREFAQYRDILCALNATDGTTIWSVVLPGYITSAPAVADGFVYVVPRADLNDYLYALNASTGAVVWGNSYGWTWAQSHSSPTVHNGILYFSSYDDKLCAINSTNGALIWEYTTGMPAIMYQTPSVAYGIVYTGTSGGYGGPGRLYALNATDGSMKWSASAVECAFYNLAVADGIAYVGKNDVYGHGVDEMRALDAFTGNIVWSYPNVAGFPIVACGSLYVSSGGKLYAFGSPVHDVAVINVTPDRTTVLRGLEAPEVTIDVTTENQGSYTEAFNVTVFANSTQIGKETVSNIYAGTKRVLSFTWDTTGFDLGKYIISAVADTVTSETDTLDNTYLDSAITVRLPVHDVAVTAVIPSQNVVIQGYILDLNVTAANQGDYSETFNVTASANTTVISQAEITLAEGNSMTLTFHWNTTDLVSGNYTINGYATQVPDEVDIADNTYIDGIVMVRLPIHDVAVVGVLPASDVILKGLNLNINGTVENQGDFIETFNVTAYANTTAIEEKEVTLNSGESAILVFAWDTTEFSLGNYSISANATILEGETDTDDNTCVNGVVMVRGPGDIAVVDVTSSKTVVGQGYPMSINVTVENQGDYTETFNVTVYANATEIETREVTLASKDSETFTFTWNTTGFSYSNYTISAAAEVLPGETDTTDNNMTDGMVLVTLVGDVNGDGKVRIDDVLAVAQRFGTDHGGSPNSNGYYYDANCDINDDLKIRVDDVLAAAQHFGQGPW